MPLLTCCIASIDERLALQRLEPARVEAGSRRTGPGVMPSSAVVAGDGWYSGSAGMRSAFQRRCCTFFEFVKMRLASPSADAVAGVDQVANLRPVLLHLEVAVVRVIPQLVGGAVLVDQPHDLAVVRREVRRELQRDHRVDLHAVGLAHVEAPPHRHLVHDLGARVPLAGDRHDLGVVAGLAQAPASAPRCAARRRRARTTVCGCRTAILMRRPPPSPCAARRPALRSSSTSCSSSITRSASATVRSIASPRSRS